MTINDETPRAVKTTAQALKQQAMDAERAHAPKTTKADGKGAAQNYVADGGVIVPVRTGSTAVAVPDTRPYTAQYIDGIAPPGAIVGRGIKWSKAGSFTYMDDDTEIGEDVDWTFLGDQTLIGWIKFIPDQPPDRRMGLLYEGFVMPARSTLGDDDPAQWPLGLSGVAEDVWKHQNCIVLQKAGTDELATFLTTSTTGRRAVGNLLRHYERTLKMYPGMLPVIRLKKSGFEHRDPRIGWVSVPSFVVVGRAPRDSVAVPDTSVGGDLNDALPDDMR
jgi:hypothetical protein